MPFLRSLRARLLLTGVLLVLATAASALWSRQILLHLTESFDAQAGENELLIRLSAELIAALEQADDALVRALTSIGDEAINEHRRWRDQAAAVLQAVAQDESSAALIPVLTRHITDYQQSSDALLSALSDPRALQRYHREVNPRLRSAVSSASQLRETAFREMQELSEAARSKAQSAVFGVTGIALLSLLLSVFAATMLTRTVLRPIRELSQSAAALRQGEFQQRVTISSEDELGALAREFNDMANSIAAFHRANLASLMRAEALLEATLEALPQPLLVVRADQGIETINQPARVLLDLTEQATPDSVQALSLTGIAVQRIALQGAEEAAGGELWLLSPEAKQTPA